MIFYILFATALIPVFIILRIVWVLARLELNLSRYPKLPGVPIFENYFFFQILEGLLDKSVNVFGKYGKILKVNLFFGLPVLIVSDLRMIEFLLSSTQILDKTFNYSFLHGWLGRGLLTAGGQKWKQTRKILTPAFHFQILENYAQIFQSPTNILMEKLKKHVDQGPFDVYSSISLCALDIICETAMGVKVNAQDNCESEYVEASRELCRIIVERSLHPVKLTPAYMLTSTYRKERQYLSILHGYTESVIKARREELQMSNTVSLKNRTAFLDLILQAELNGRPMRNCEIRQEVDTFMFEGHDTTSSGISFTLYCLSKHPDIQERVFKEINAIFGDDRHRSATVKELQEMKYLDMVIKESLRFYPPVPVFGRTPMKDSRCYDGILPQYCQILIFAYAVHRDPRVYPEPEKFDPDRFLPENKAKRHPFSYLAFSAGQRNCIGQKFAMLEIKSVISHILRNFLIKPAKNYTPEILPLAVLKSKNGVLIQLEERKVSFDL